MSIDTLPEVWLLGDCLHEFRETIHKVKVVVFVRVVVVVRAPVDRARRPNGPERAAATEERTRSTQILLLYRLSILSVSNKESLTMFFLAVSDVSSQGKVSETSCLTN